MLEIIKEFSSEILTFAIAMLPVAELRAAIPYAVLNGLPWWLAYILSVLGNLLPVPFILVFIKKIIEWMSKSKHFYKIGDWLLNKAQKNVAKVQKYELIGLAIFVAIPLPGTGAWTGAMAAGVLGLRFKFSMISIIIGVIIAGFIMSVLSYGVAAIIPAIG